MVKTLSGVVGMTRVGRGERQSISVLRVLQIFRFTTTRLHGLAIWPVHQPKLVNIA